MYIYKDRYLKMTADGSVALLSDKKIINIKIYLFITHGYSSLPLQFLSTHEVRGDIAVDFSVRASVRPANPPSVPFLVKVFLKW